MLEVHDAHALAAELERALVLRPSDVPDSVVTMNSEVEYEDVATQERADYEMAAPTAEHVLPLAYIAALAEQCGDAARGPHRPGGFSCHMSRGRPLHVHIA